MRILFVLSVVTLCLGAVALASVPDPDQCTVEPWDTYGKAFVAPGDTAGSRSSIDNVTVTVRNGDGDPISGAEVVIDVGQGGGGLTPQCPNLCLDPVDPKLEGVTDENGVAVLNPRVGGCDTCTVTVKADYVTIAFYNFINSTDWNGVEADGDVDGLDLTYFAIQFAGGQNRCADYDGDYIVGGIDLTMFAISFASGDSNPNGCE